jgi:hypothetical protein
MFELFLHSLSSSSVTPCMDAPPPTPLNLATLLRHSEKLDHIVASTPTPYGIQWLLRTSPREENFQISSRNLPVRSAALRIPR